LVADGYPVGVRVEALRLGAIPGSEADLTCGEDRSVALGSG
jgi:hypothetical protein